MWSRRSRS
jgi:hypothetical protein